jgi:LSD1 subclass zinc finger protein
LPAAADGAHVTCEFCKAATVIEYGGAAMVREQASRKEAEALFATLGQPPSLSQRIAVGLTNKWLWIIGLPFMLAFLLRVSQVPEHAMNAAWELLRHERLRHVAPPMMSWLLGVGWQAAVILGLLVWSLLGERIDARRDLQAALACKPPKTEGGPGLCRHCDAPLTIAPGALGVRCTFCGADNLLQVPASWSANAAAMDKTLRLSVRVARRRAQEGARRLFRAAMWRVPFVLAVLALLALPLRSLARRASWSDMRYERARGVGVYQLAVWHQGDTPTPSLRSYTACDDANARAALLPQSPIATGDTKWCEGSLCTAVSIFALTRGDHLRLDWSAPGPVAVRIALGDQDYAGGVMVLGESFGDEVSSTSPTPAAIGQTAVDVPIAISGLYKVEVRGAPGLALEPCVVPARNAQ